MKNLSVVRLSYDNKDRVKFQIIAEFLRLAGIYVDEDCRTLSRFTDAANDDNEFTFYYEIEPVQGDIKYWSINLQKDVLNEFLYDYGEKIGEESALYEALDNLQPIFLKNELFKASLTLQYFKYDNQMTLKDGELFYKAANEIEKLLQSEGFYHNPNMRYARIYCFQKVNLSRTLCKKPIAKFVNFLADDCLELIKEFPDFSNVWVLLGLCYDIMQEKSWEVINAFKHALEKVGSLPFSSSIYYWLGKRYERLQIFEDEAEDAYKRAYGVAHKYRNIYKLGMARENRKDWEHAVKYYKECLEFLKKKNYYWDLLEVEYFYKTSIRLGYLYIYKLEQYNLGIKILWKALEFRDGLKDSMGNIKANDYISLSYQIYGNNALQYLQIVIRRMAIRQVYLYLSEAFEILSMPERSENYRKLAND